MKPAQPSERIGVFGGTFNPIHNGHLSIARGFLRQLSLDRVLFIPTSSPPHKQDGGILEADLRYEMCRAACAEDPRFETSSLEITRGGTSYTVDTLRELKVQYPNAELFLITGADMFLTLESWKNFKKIARLAQLCACARHDGETEALRSFAQKLTLDFGARCHIGRFGVVDVSSTEVRERLQSGGSVTGLVPAGVERLIERRGLYRPVKTGADGGPDRAGKSLESGESLLQKEEYDRISERFRGILKGRLSEDRYYHSCRVSEEAAFLAGLYGGDENKAAFAGLVHDIEKDTPKDGQLRTIEKYSIILDDVQKSTPKLYHAIAGAAVLLHEHNVTDTDILNAVRYHTTARAGMSLLEKIIYLADYISADRDFKGVAELRRTSHASLEKGMQECLRFSITELAQKPALIHPDTVGAWNELIAAK